jgi:hypothetical protein
MKFLKIFSYSFFFITLSSLIIFFTLGNFLDITQKAKKSDIIFCLGGGDGARISKTLLLYKNQYSNSSLLVITGDNRSKKRKELNMQDKRVDFLKENLFNMQNLIQYPSANNTKNEILFIKEFMRKHNLKTAIIVSDAPHSRRINTLLNLIDIKSTDNFIFNIVSSDASWWNSNRYYTNKKSTVFAVREIIKLIYTYIAFGILDKFGILQPVKEFTKPYYNKLKKEIDKTTYFYLKNTSS